MTEIKIDRSTLPKDGQKIRWQTAVDIDHSMWKHGIFVEGDDIFHEGFDDTSGVWDTSFEVHHWESLEKQ